MTEKDQDVSLKQKKIGSQQSVGGSRLQRQPRQRVGNDTAPPTVEDAVSVAKRVKPDLPETVASRVCHLFENGPTLWGQGPTAFDALTEIAQARRDGWDWHPNGAKKIGPNPGLHDPVTVPWWIVVHFAVKWREFATEGKYETLDDAFDTKANKGGRYHTRRKEKLQIITRAIEVANLIGQGISRSEALAAVADHHGVDERTALNNLNQNQNALTNIFPKVKLIKRSRNSDT